jgi:hypothetical protein
MLHMASLDGGWQRDCGGSLVERITRRAGPARTRKAVLDVEGRAGACAQLACAEEGIVVL